MSLPNKLHYWLTLLVAFLLPIWQKGIPVMVLLIGLNWLFLSKNLLERIKNISNKKWVYCCTAFYALHIIGLLYSEDFAAGRLDLEIKMSFLFVPLIYASSKSFNRLHYHIILAAHIIGCIVAVLYCLKNSSYNYHMEAQWIEHFFSSRFSALLHIGYFAMHLNLAIISLVYLIQQHRKKITSRVMVFIFLGLLILILGLVLTTSKMGLLTLSLLAILFGMYLLFSRGRVVLGLSVLVGIIVVVFAAFNASDITSARLMETLNTISNPIDEKSSSNSTAARTLVWNSSIEVIKENWLLGVGTGDIKEALRERYRQNNYKAVLALNLNSHNQFLQTAGALGILGLLLLLVCFTYPLYKGFARGKSLLIAFSFIVLLAALTESIIEVQAGVLYYAFFGSVLLYSDTEEEE